MFEDNILLALDEYNSNFIYCDLSPAIYTFEDLSEVYFNTLQPDCPGYNSSVDIELDDISMKTKLVVRPGSIAIRFD